MKRVDMIKLIVDSIELYNDNDPGWLEYPEARKVKEKAYEVADKLLSDIEAAGMLPPNNGKLVTNYTDMGTMPDQLMGRRIA